MPIAANGNSVLGVLKASVSSFTGSIVTWPAGDTAVIVMAVNGSHVLSSATITDPAGNTYTLLDSAASSTGSWAVFVASILSGFSGTHTVGFGTSVTAYAVGAQLFTGLSTTLDGTIASGASGSSLSRTPTATTDLAVGFGIADTNVGTNWGTQASFTQAPPQNTLFTTGGNASTNVALSMQFDILSSASTVSFNPSATTAGQIGLFLLKIAAQANPLAAPRIHQAVNRATTF